MIKITNNSVIIEIPTVSPLEDINSMQKGLLHLIGNIDVSERNVETQNALWQAHRLLSQMLFTPEQAVILQSQIGENSELTKAFAA